MGTMAQKGLECDGMGGHVCRTKTLVAKFEKLAWF